MSGSLTILQPERRSGGIRSQRPGISVGVGGGGKPNYIYGYEYDTYGGYIKKSQDFQL